MKRFALPLTFAVLLAIAPASVFALGSSLEVGVSAMGGISVVGGGWRDSVDTFSEDFGQETETGLFPAFSSSAFARLRFGPRWCAALSVGAGSWGGRVVSEGDTADDRFSTLAGIGVEIVPSAGLRFPLGRGEAGADLKLGFGILASPLWVREAWADVDATASYDLSFARRVYFLTGAEFSYAVPIRAYWVAALLAADVGFASFSKDVDASVLGRFGIGFRVSREFSSHKGPGR